MYRTSLGPLGNLGKVLIINYETRNPRDAIDRFLNIKIPFGSEDQRTQTKDIE